MATRWAGAGARVNVGAALWCAVIAAEVAALAGVAFGSPGRASFRPLTITSKILAPSRYPSVTLIAFALGSDLLVAGGRALLLDGAPRPFVGLARGWYHVETALVLGWPCALALAAWRLFTWAPRGWWKEAPPAVAWGSWLGVSVGLVLAHPLGRVRTAACLLVVEFVALAVVWLAVARGWRRPWTLPHVAVLVLAGVETSVALIGPWVRNPFADWHLARVSYLLGFSVVALLHVQKVRDRAGL